MAVTPTVAEKIVLGSGQIFVQEFTDEIPTDILLEVDENKLGDVLGGAVLTYKPKLYTAKSDDGTVAKTIVTEEEATLKSGVMTWCGNTLAKLAATARVTETAGKRTILIGGIGMQDGKKYVVRFLHSDPVFGTIRVTIVGTNQAGFALAFAKDKETVVDAEFTALPSDADGTLIIYEEQIPTV